jgi:hypothetical protein
MMDMSISQANVDIVYLGFFDMGIWRSLDKGESWENCNDEVFSGDWEGFGGNCATILADPERANVVWASLSGNQEGEHQLILLKMKILEIKTTGVCLITDCQITKLWDYL